MRTADGSTSQHASFFKKQAISHDQATSAALGQAAMHRQHHASSPRLCFQQQWQQSWQPSDHKVGALHVEDSEQRWATCRRRGGLSRRADVPLLGHCRRTRWRKNRRSRHLSTQVLNALPLSSSSRLQMASVDQPIGQGSLYEGKSRFAHSTNLNMPVLCITESSTARSSLQGMGSQTH